MLVRYTCLVILSGVVLFYSTACSMPGSSEHTDRNGTESQEKKETEAEEFSIEALVQKLEEGVRQGQTEIECIYKGKADKLNAQVNEELEEALAGNHLCSNLLSGVDMQWEQQGKNVQGKFSLTYQEDVSLPVLFAENKDAVVKALITGWELGEQKVTVVMEKDLPSEEEVFAMLDGAEINCASVPCEADAVYYQAYDAQDGMQIFKMWEDFGTDAGSLKQQKEELSEKIIQYAEDIRGQAESVEERYQAAYQKILELAQYDDSIAMVTDSNRLGLQTRIQRSAYGALVDGNTVCTGYARGYKALCDALDLPCQVVAGTKDGVNHAWNRVRLGEELLYVDCTAGDTGSPKEETLLFTQEQLENNGYIMDDNYVIPVI